MLTNRQNEMGDSKKVDVFNSNKRRVLIKSGGLEKHRKINKRGDVYFKPESKREEGI